MSDCALLGEALELVQLLVQHVLDRAQLAAVLVVAGAEDRLLGLLHQRARVARLGGHLLLDFAGAPEQPAQHRVLAHDPRVVAHRAAAGTIAGRECT